jgi:hypothetical protein
VQGIIAESSALRVLLDPMGVHPVFIRIAVDADPSIGMRRMLTTGPARIMLLFRFDAEHGVGSGLNRGRFQRTEADGRYLAREGAETEIENTRADGHVGAYLRTRELEPLAATVTFSTVAVALVLAMADKSRTGPGRSAVT